VLASIPLGQLYELAKGGEWLAHFGRARGGAKASSNYVGSVEHAGGASGAGGGQGGAGGAP